MTTIRLEILGILEKSTRGWLHSKQRRLLLYNMVFFQNINLAFEADGRTKVVCYGFYFNFKSIGIRTGRSYLGRTQSSVLAYA
jgi:hypothetical protein